MFILNLVIFKKKIINKEYNRFGIKVEKLVYY